MPLPRGFGSNSVRCCREQRGGASTWHHRLTRNRYDFCYVTVRLTSVKITDLQVETLCVSSVQDSHCRKGNYQNYYPNLREENRALEITGDFQESVVPTIGASSDVLWALN